MRQGSCKWKAKSNASMTEFKRRCKVWQCRCTFAELNTLQDIEIDQLHKLPKLMTSKV